LRGLFAAKTAFRLCSAGSRQLNRPLIIRKDSMSDWTEGYVTEIDYTLGYYRELSPTLQRFALNYAGYSAPPENGSYLELGFGLGLSAAIHAASTPSQIWATDFNPSHAAHAQGLIKAAGIEAQLFDESFAELDARTDLPKFQYISLHGIWSWISDENRDHITSILRRHLAVGGVGYVSYNCFPGWAAAAPLRNLLSMHSELAGAEAQGLTTRLDSAMAFAQQLVDKGALYFRANPIAAERLKKLTDQNRNYLAHEYLNREWHVMGFKQLADWLSPAKLDFAASVHMLDQVEAVNLSADARALMQGIANPILRESVRDYFVNQQFRRDLFVRGPRRMSMLEQREALLATGFSLLVRAEDIPLKVTGALGEATLQEAIYRPLLDVFVKNGYRPRTVAQLHQDLPEISLQQLVEALAVLVGAAFAHPAQPEQAIRKAQSRTAALNAELARRARSTNDIAFMASPVIGAGATVGRFQQLFLSALAGGHKTPEDWARAVWSVIAAQGQGLLKDGKPLATPEENLAELTAQAREFAEKRLPVLKGLGIAP